MIVTAPESLRTELRGHSATKLLDIRAAFEPDLTALDEPTHAIKLSQRTLACRTRELRREAAELKAPHCARPSHSPPQNIVGARPRTRYGSRAPDHSRRQSRPSTIRIVLHTPLRCCPDPRALRDNHPTSTSPRRRPTRQSSAAHRCRRAPPIPRPSS